MNILLTFVTSHPYLLSLVLFIVAIVLSKPTKRKKLLSIGIFALSFSFIAIKLLDMSFQNPTQFVTSYLYPLFEYVVKTPFFENQILICLTIAAVVFAEYKRAGLLFALLSILLAYNKLMTQEVLLLDIVGGAIIAILVTLLANKIIEKFY